MIITCSMHDLWKQATTKTTFFSLENSPHAKRGFFTLDARLLARSQYSEGPATGHLDTGFLFSMCLKGNPEMVPKFPSCHYMFLM